MAEPLPSQQSAANLVAGKSGAWLEVTMHAAARGALIGLGAALLGVPEKYWVKAGVGGTLAVEAFVLIHEALNRSNNT